MGENELWFPSPWGWRGSSMQAIKERAGLGRPHALSSTGQGRACLFWQGTDIPKAQPRTHLDMEAFMARAGYGCRKPPGGREYMGCPCLHGPGTRTSAQILVKFMWGRWAKGGRDASRSKEVVEGMREGKKAAGFSYCGTSQPRGWGICPTAPGDSG